MFAVVLKNGYVQFYDETLQLLSISFGGLPESSMLDVSRVFNNIRYKSTSYTKFDYCRTPKYRPPLVPQLDYRKCTVFKIFLQKGHSNSSY